MTKYLRDVESPQYPLAFPNTLKEEETVRENISRDSDMQRRVGMETDCKEEIDTVRVMAYGRLHQRSCTDVN